MKRHKAEIAKQEDTGRWRWELKNAGGDVVASSQILDDYATKKEAEKGAREAVERVRFVVCEREPEGLLPADEAAAGWYWEERDAENDLVAEGGPFPNAAEAGDAANREAEKGI